MRETLTITNSAMIGAIAYEPVAKECDVYLLNGKHFTYIDVSASNWEAFKGADSYGKFFNRQVRGRWTPKPQAAGS